MPLKASWAPFFIFFWAISTLIAYVFERKENRTANFLFLKDLSDVRTALLLFWVFALISGLWAEDKSLINAPLETKLSFLLAPFLFSMTSINVLWIKRFLLAFLLGNLAAFAWNIGDSFQSYLASGKLISFIMKYFSDLVHPSYWGMYLIFCLLLLGYFYLWKTFPARRQTALFIILGLIFLIALALIQSKNAIVALVFIPVMLLVWLIVKKGKWKKGLLAFIGIMVFVGTLFYITPNLQVRFAKMYDSINKSAIQSSSKSSTDARLVAWNASLELIKERPILGYGIGQEKNSLVYIYKRDRFEFAEEKRLDSHSQFLFTWISGGILAFSSLMYLFIILVYQGIKRKNGLMVLFSILVFFSCLTESMFESQSGVLFFVFFALLLSKMPIGRKQIA
ncbi:MAG: O-antigen ligase family protein [Bacteroidota bacterium]